MTAAAGAVLQDDVIILGPADGENAAIKAILHRSAVGVVQNDFGHESDRRAMSMPYLPEIHRQVRLPGLRKAVTSPCPPPSHAQPSAAPRNSGEVVEWFMAAVLKTADG